MDSNTLEYQVRTERNTRSALKWNSQSRYLRCIHVCWKSCSTVDCFWKNFPISHNRNISVINPLTQYHSFLLLSLSSLLPPPCILWLPCLHPLPSSPSHQGLKSMTMFLLQWWVVVVSPLMEPQVTVSPYWPHTALAGELTDSFTLLPLCSTILASQRLSFSESTNRTVAWVPLDTVGRGPTPQNI